MNEKESLKQSLDFLSDIMSDKPDKPDKPDTLSKHIEKPTIIKSDVLSELFTYKCHVCHHSEEYASDLSEKLTKLTTKDCIASKIVFSEPFKLVEHRVFAEILRDFHLYSIVHANSESVSFLGENVSKWNSFWEKVCNHATIVDMDRHPTDLFLVWVDDPLVPEQVLHNILTYMKRGGVIVQKINSETLNEWALRFKNIQCMFDNITIVNSIQSEGKDAYIIFDKFKTFEKKELVDVVTMPSCVIELFEKFIIGTNLQRTRTVKRIEWLQKSEIKTPSYFMGGSKVASMQSAMFKRFWTGKISSHQIKYQQYDPRDVTVNINRVQPSTFDTRSQPQHYSNGPNGYIHPDRRNDRYGPTRTGNRGKSRNRNRGRGGRGGFRNNRPEKIQKFLPNFNVGPMKPYAYVPPAPDSPNYLPSSPLAYNSSHCAPNSPNYVPPPSPNYVPSSPYVPDEGYDPTNPYM